MAPRTRRTAPDDAAQLCAALGVDLEQELLTRALTHRSFAYENGGLPHNERLEFLGDSVLGIVVTDSLYRAHPDFPEGRLAKLRASVVNMRALAGVARGIGPDGLGAYLYLGRGEESTGGRDKSSILADALEAMLGAVYLEHGIDAAARIVHELFDELMRAAAESGAGLDWKTSLQELTAERSLGVPEYRMSSSGPDHAKTFSAAVAVGPEIFAASLGRSKKEAEQAAAETAWRVISARPPDTVPGDAEPADTVPAVAASGAMPALPALPGEAG